MVEIKSLDENISIMQQLATDQSQVVLINLFDVAKEDTQALIKAWENDANWMKKQPGYISTQLHRGIAGSTVFINYAVWESVEHFRNAFTHPEFQNTLKAYPSSAVASPHLFETVAVENLCTGTVTP